MNEILDRIFDKLSAEDIYTDGAHHFKKSGDRLRGGCPWHNSKSGTSFVVSRSTKSWWCAGCGTGGGPLQYLHRLDGGDGSPRGQEFVTLVKQLCERAGVEFPENAPRDDDGRIIFLQERSALLENIIEFCREQLTPEHLEYLRSRGFEREDVESLEIGYYDVKKLRAHLKGYPKHLLDGTGVLSPKLDGYLVFPWRDDKGRPLTLYFKWTAKTPPGDGRPKTTALMNPKMDGKEALSTKYVPYCFDRAKGEKDLVLVEGVTDAALAQVRGDKRVVACVAAQLSAGQVKTLKSHGVKSVTICLDPDSAGDRGIDSCCRQLTEVGIKSLVAPRLPDGQDPDEFIMEHGIDAWREHIGRAIPKTGECPLLDKKERLLKHKKASEALMPYLNDLLFDSTTMQWLQYIGNVWKQTTVNHALAVLDHLITRLAPKLDYNTSWRDAVLSQISLYLRWDDREPPEDAIPFRNGVLFLNGMRFEPHNRDHRFTWQLPFVYDPSATCEPVQAWLMETVGDPMQVELLRAYLAAILTGRADLQRYLELIGAASSGKGTFTRLAEALIGKENVHVSELKHLEGNRFELARLYQKRLCLITDSSKYAGNVDNFKAMTGGDSLRFEEKHKQCGASFRFKGMVLIAANEHIASSDYTSGLQRRRITVLFDKTVPPDKRRNLDEEFKPYLPGVINWVLGMPRGEVTDILRNTDARVKTLAGASMQTLIATNPLAEWAHEELVYSSDQKTFIGRAERDPQTRQLLDADEKLYPNYVRWCDGTGHKPIASNRCVMLLKDLLLNQLRLEGFSHKHERAGNCFSGIGIRKAGTSDLPSPLEAYFGANGGDAPVKGGERSVTYQVTDQTRTVTNVKDFSQYYSEKKEASSNVAGVEEKNMGKNSPPRKPVTSVTEPIQPVTDPSQPVTGDGLTVKCRDCTHFIPDAKHPDSQVGRCTGEPENGYRSQWPFTNQTCGGFVASPT